MAEETKFFVKLFRVIRNKKVAEYVPDGAEMLDVGCGPDYFLLQAVSGKIKSGIGIDIAVRNMEKGNIKIRRLRLHDKLPFRPASFDAVTMIAFIEHLDRPKEILAECRRVLKKGGRLIITTPMQRAKPFWEALVKLGMTEEKTTEDHKHYFTQKEIETLMRKNRFKVIVSEKFEAGMNYIAVGEKK